MTFLFNSIMWFLRNTNLENFQMTTPCSPFVWPQPVIPKRPDILQESIQETDYLKLILNARVYNVASESPLTLATKLSSRLENTIYLKREDLQPIFSFKCRGSYNRMAQLTLQEREKG